MQKRIYSNGVPEDMVKEFENTIKLCKNAVINYMYGKIDKIS